MSLSPEKAVLVLAGVGMIALMGVPNMGTYQAPGGPVTGVVSSADGDVIEGAEVALFDSQRLSLIERTFTDERGRFGFAQSPGDFELFASTETDTPHFAGAWAQMHRDENGVAVRRGDYALVLPAARTTEVIVTGSRDRRIVGAEVRILQAPPHAAVIERVLTDDDGIAHVHIPTGTGMALMAVLAPNGGPERWIADPLAGSEESGSGHEPNARIEVRLGDGHTLAGVVRDEDGAPVPGLTVCAWDGDLDAPGPPTEAFGGWTTTDENGSFLLQTATATTRLRITDAQGAFVPLAQIVPTTSTTTNGELELRVSAGRPFDVLITASDSGTTVGVRSRVWVHTNPGNVWSPGTLSDDEGRATVRIMPMASPSIVVQPLPTFPPLQSVERWDGIPGEREVQLESTSVEEER